MKQTSVVVADCSSTSGQTRRSYMGRSYNYSINSGLVVLVLCVCQYSACVLVCVTSVLTKFYIVLGYWHQRADERHGIGNPPQGNNQELLMVRDKVRRPQVNVG